MTTVKASWWSITINNPTDEDRAALSAENWPPFVKGVDYQYEVGNDGTLHIQGALNTAQVRFSAVKGWLKRAHIEAARNRAALLKYVKKQETAVPGTQTSEKREYLTMEAALKKLANFYEPASFERVEQLRYDSKKVAVESYWKAVNKLLLEDTSLIQLYSNPQMLRAWVYTKNVWLEYKNASGTNIEVQERPQGNREEGSEASNTHQANEVGGEEDSEWDAGDEV